MLASALVVVLGGSLMQGEVIGDRPYVEDTTLLATQPDDNFGREPYLVSGDGRAFLMRFPDVGLRKPENGRVASAKIVLTAFRSDAVGQVSVSAVNRPWFEGPGRLTAALLAKPEDQRDPTAWGAATWKSALNMADGGRWQEAGASGIQDRRGLDVSATQQGVSLEISGLAETVQAWVDRPEENFGLRVTTTSDAVFFSAEDMEKGPRLEIVWAERGAVAGPDLAVTGFWPNVGNSGWPMEGDMVKWTAEVENVGSVAAPGGMVSYWLPNGEKKVVWIENEIVAGESVRWSVDMPWKVNLSDIRRGKVGVRVDSAVVNGEVSDVDLSNGYLPGWMGGMMVSVGGVSGVEARKMVGWVNQVVMPFSRFLGTEDGVYERVNLVDDGDVNVEIGSGGLKDFVRGLTGLGNGFAEPPVAGLASWDGLDRGQLGWLPDTRDAGALLKGLSLSHVTWENDRKIADVPMRDSGLLSRTEAGFLQRNLGRRNAERELVFYELPETVGLELSDLQGNPLTFADVEVFRVRDGKLEDEPVLRTKTTRGRLVVVPSKSEGGKPKNPFGEISSDGRDAWLFVRVNRGGAVGTAWVPGWAVWDLKMRGNDRSGTVDVRMMMTDAAVDQSVNLADGKIVTGSGGQFPAELVALIDGQTDQSVEFRAGQWLELDLGRDRAFGEVEIVTLGGGFEAFDLYSYKTGQTPKDAKIWYRERQGGLTSMIYGEKSGDVLSTRYQTSSVASRYLRLVNSGDDVVKVAEIRVRPVKREG